MTQRTYHSSCHCGAVELEITPVEPLETAQRCDCSYCRRRAAATISVKLQDLRVVNGAKYLTLYTFNTHTAKHRFCEICGIYMYHQRRSDPSVYGVNLYTITGTDPKDFEPLPWSDGINHESDRVD